MFYIPLWVFYRGNETLDDFSQLRGKRINIGPEGSSVRKFALDLLKAANSLILRQNYYEFPHTASKKAMMEGKIDVIMVFGTADNPLCRKCFTVRILN